METLSVSRFKMTCLAVLEQVDKQKKKVLITKRGRPIAEIVPDGISSRPGRSNHCGHFQDFGPAAADRRP